MALFAPGCAKNVEPAPAPELETAIAKTSQELTTQTKTTLVASRDTSIRSSDPNRNFGDDDTLEINRALIAFDQNALRAALGPQDRLDAASLEITLTDNEVRRRDPARAANLFRLTSAWTEDGATFNCADDSRPANGRRNCTGANRWSMDSDPPNPWATPATDTAAIVARQTGIVDFDVTADVKGFLDGKFANNGWMVRGNASGEFAEFASRETKTPPKLVLTISHVNNCTPASCDDGNVCTVDACDAAGACTHTAATEGTTCSDGNACTQSDSCHAGKCVAGAPVICAASDQCHAAGTCDTSTGLCSNPALADGTACNDGTACTQSDSCQAGACVGSNPVTCTASDQCHAAGTCDPASGACSNPTVTDGTACSDSDACTQSDSCQAGACVGSNPVTCTASNQCHAAGTCDPTTGACSNPAVADGTVCTDGSACTLTDACVAGACIGANPVICAASDQCHAAGTCDPASGACSNPSLADGTACNDGSACTRSDTCQAGACSGGDPVVCTASDQCHAAGTCDAATGACSNPAVADGTACNDGNGCTIEDACRGGTCTAGFQRACPNGADACHPGVCDPGTGSCSNPLACKLIGTGAVPATLLDGLDVRPLTLADGTPHNQIGGFGSAIAYTGVGNLYLTAPDRGPGGGSVPFVDRYYQIELTVANGVVSTFFRGGATLNKSPGTPFIGLATAFDATGSPDSLRFDPEGLRVSPQGTFFVSDEYGPYLSEFDATGNRLRSFAVPAKFLVAKPGVDDAELPPGNTSGRQANRGMEGLAITPDGSKLYGIMQSPLIQDNALSGSNKRNGTNSRILEVDVATGATREFLYQLYDKDFGVNEILAVNDHQFVAIERDGDGGNDAKFKKLVLVDLAGATDISGIESLPKTATPDGVTPVSKTPFLDLLSPDYGLAGPAFPEKIEGIAFGPDQADGSHLLLVTQDNDFLADTPSRIFAFSVAPTALPAFKAQNASFSDVCVSPAPITCPSTEPCRHDGMCNPGTAACVPPALPAGTAAGTQVPGDCQKSQCNGDGSLVSVADDTDVPGDDGNQCTSEACSGGSPSHPFTGAGSTCDQFGGKLCNGVGACIQCVVASDCAGSDTECRQRTCNFGTCGFNDSPLGLVVSSQIPGDCHKNQCDGLGQIVSVVDDTDLPNSNNACTSGVCTGGVPGSTAAPLGSPCGGGVCDGAGTCIGCVTAQDCPGSDTECSVRTCNAGACGTTFAPANTFISAQIDGDCHDNLCDGAGNVVSVVDNRDIHRDHIACTDDICTNGVPSNPNSPVNTPCAQSGGNSCDGAGSCIGAFTVVRMGLAGGPSLGSGSSAVFVDEFDIGGRLLRTVPLPTATAGAQRRFGNSGQAGSEGALALSGDGHFVTLAGYDVAPGTAGVAGTASATTNRVVARVDAAGNVDTSTTINNSFNANNVRGAVTFDGNQFWVSGPAGGVQFVLLGGTASTPISQNLTNVRTVQIVGEQLFGSAMNGNFNNVFTVGTGLPTASTANNVVALPGFPVTAVTPTPSPYAFVFIGDNLLYVADDRTIVNGGGIQKWLLTFDANNKPLWTLQKTITGGLGTTGARGLAGYLSDTGIVLIATTADAANPSGQRIVTLVDTGTNEPTATTIVTGSTSVAYRGVALAPQ